MAETNAQIPDSLRSELVKKIEDNKADLIEALMALALGVEGIDYTLAPGEKRKFKLYEKPPDKEALMYLLNQVIGKPKEQMKLSGASGPVRFVFADVEEEDDNG